ncbi:response regulator [Aliivibrio kagoshimensis]|uniref:response regulator n=1 Tax=Aliivibrio kagoshimensis TaxID=2910230 RepID=UPI003D0A85D1
MWNVVIVDDHPLMRRGIGQLLSYEPEFTLIGEASNGADAVALIQQEEPDLILLDLNMKGMSGLDTLNALRELDITSTIIILTVSDSRQDVKTLIEAGADGYLLKDTDPDDLITLLKDAMQGSAVFSKQLKEYLHQTTEMDELLASLTKRETEILQEVSKGFRNKQIADRLFISEATVKVHMKSLLKKLKVQSRVAATLLYIESQE